MKETLTWWENHIDLNDNNIKEAFQRDLGLADAASRLELARWLKRIGAAKVLDYGAGLGTFAGTLQMHYPLCDYCAMDATPKFVESMKAKGLEAYHVGDDSNVLLADAKVVRHVFDHFDSFDSAAKVAEWLGGNTAIVFFLPMTEDNYIVNQRVSDGLYHVNYAKKQWDDWACEVDLKTEWKTVEGEHWQEEILFLTSIGQ